LNILRYHLWPMDNRHVKFVHADFFLHPMQCA
jgi:hypothetical protein